MHPGNPSRGGQSGAMCGLTPWLGLAAQLCSASKTISTVPKRPQVAWYSHHGTCPPWPSAPYSPSLRRQPLISVPSRTRTCHTACGNQYVQHLPSCTLVLLPLPKPGSDFCSHLRGLEGFLPLSNKTVSAKCALLGVGVGVGMGGWGGLEGAGNHLAQRPVVSEQLYFQGLLWI